MAIRFDEITLLVIYVDHLAWPLVYGALLVTFVFHIFVQTDKP
jgi:hypothetical protein